MNTTPDTSMRTLYWIAAVCFLTASFDVILVIDVGGTLHLSQLLLVLLCVAAIARIVQDGRVLWPRGGTAIALWLLIQVLFLPNSGDALLASPYTIFAALFIAGHFAILQIFGRSRWVGWLFQAYLFSFIFVGFFGLLQFATPLLGLPSLLVKQWIIHGRIARINGFNYEPSFYATYLVMGWIMLVDLRASRAKITQGRVWLWITIAMGASLVLSSSRTAWIFMLVEAGLRLWPLLTRRFRRVVNQLREGRLTARTPRLITVVGIGALVAIAISIRTGLTNTAAAAIILLQGTGVAGTASHSYTQRLNAVTYTWQAFVAEPFLGHTLGGVSIFIASRNGVILHSIAEMRDVAGFPVLLDLLVASGIFGIIPFLVFVYRNTVGAHRLATLHLATEQGKWLRALARAMIYECLLLQADQNVLRIYVWYQVSMVALIAYRLEFVTSTEPSPAPRTFAPAQSDPAPTPLLA